MSERRVSILVGVVTLVLQLLLHAGALSALSGDTRLLLSFLVLVVSPGAALLVAMRVRIPGGALFSAGWAVAVGVAAQSALVLVTRAAGQPFTVLGAASAVPTSILWCIAMWRGGDERASGFGLPASAVSNLARALVLVAAALALLHLLQLPTPIGYDTDSPDHIGTLRRMLASGDAFPRDAFFRDAGAAGADPRKGLWHPVAALIAALARVDVLHAWRGLAALLAATFVLSAGGLGFMLGGWATASVAAWALLLTYGGSLAGPYLREAVFATKLADQFVFVTLAAVLHDLDERSTASRCAAVLVGLGAVATHVFAAMEFAVVFGALGVALVLRERGIGPLSKRLLVTGSLLGAACLPYLGWRAMHSYGPRNIIHTEKQGMLTLWPGAEIVTVRVLWEWMGLAWMTIPLSLVALARASRRPAVLCLLSTSLAVPVLMFFPPLVGVLQPKLGYLMMRFVWIFPLSGVLAFSIVALARAVPRRRAVAIGGLFGVALLLAGPLRDGVRSLANPSLIARDEAKRSMLRWTDALRWMDTHLPEGTVVLSDPVTSYSIPMLTRHWVVTLEDQHSSPNDSLALTRLLDSRDALDPDSPWSRLREVMRRWGANTIALNNRFGESPRLTYWTASPPWFRASRARLDARPDVFKRVYDTGDFVVYTVAESALDRLTGGGAARPYVRDADLTMEPLSGDRPRVVGAGVSQSAVHAGDSLLVWVDWSVPVPQRAGSYRVYLRFDAPLPAAVAKLPRWLGKPARKIAERLSGELYRFRSDHLPVGGRFGVDLWRPGSVIRDSAMVAVPTDASAETFEVQATLLGEPDLPNLRLSDYFFDRDHYSGARIGSVRVLPTRPGR